jgi:hypothetical protein
MTQTQNRPVRWCPECDAVSTLSEDVWQEIEETKEEVPCPMCFACPQPWSKRNPR